MATRRQRVYTRSLSTLEAGGSPTSVNPRYDTTSMDFSWTAEQRQRYADCVAFAEQDLNADVADRDAAGDFRLALWQRCATQGVLGWNLPVEYGGSGLDVPTTVRMLEGIGYGCRDNALTLGLNCQLWCVQLPILEFGSEDQRQRYLPRLAAGEMLGAYALTETESGSDTLNLTTRADKVAGGSRLHGRKSFISLSPVADVALVFASTDPQLGKWGISAFLVDRDSAGFVATPPRPKMGLRAVPLGDIVLEDCFVRDENRLGPEGGGLSVFNHSMEWERAFILTSHVGSMARQLDECVKYARERQQAGKPIIEFQSVSNRLAEMKLRLETSQLLLYKLAWMKGQGQSAALAASLANLHISESFVANSLDAIRIHGARGYLTEFEIERDLRDAMGGVIYSGTSDIQRNIVARVLGFQQD